MTNDEETSRTPAQRIIFATRQRVQEVRNQYHRERVAGSVSEATHRELATVALQYRDVLAEHADERIVKDHWEESAVDELERLVGERRYVDVEAPGDTSNTRRVAQPAVLAVSHGAIYQATKRLDYLAKRLGFAASARQKTPRDEGDLSDLYHLLGRRGQTEAQARLPYDGDDEEDADDEGGVDESGADRDDHAVDVEPVPDGGADDEGGD
jgi:hypothetical protein